MNKASHDREVRSLGYSAAGVDFQIEHTSAAQNKVADVLSRMPVGAPESPPSDDPAVFLFGVVVASKWYFTLCQQGGVSLRGLFEAAAASPDGAEGSYGRLILKKGVLYRVNPGKGRRFTVAVPTELVSRVMRVRKEVTWGRRRRWRSS